MRKRWIKRKTSKHGEFGLKKTWCLSCLLGPKVLFLVHKMEQLFSLLSVHFQEKKNRKKKKKKRRKRHQLCSTLTWSRGWHAWMWGHLSFIAWLLLVLCLAYIITFSQVFPMLWKWHPFILFLLKNTHLRHMFGGKSFHDEENQGRYCLI